MNALQTIKDVFSTNGVVIYECRRCGTTVDSESDPCPFCELDCIARYDIR